MPQQVYITHISSFLPNILVSNDDMESILGAINGRPSRVRKLILRSNKITSRYYAIDPKTGNASHSNTELTAEAIRKLQDQGCDLSQLSLLACGTTLPDQLIPNHALMVQGELALPPCEAVATSGICLSGMMALKYGYLSIRASETTNAIATGSENVSSLMRGHLFTEESEKGEEQLQQNKKELAFEKDFLRWMLSDGAGAVWMSECPLKDGLSLRIDWIKQTSYAGELATCMYAGAEKNHTGQLDGWRTFLPQAWMDESIFAIKQDVKLLNEKIIEYTVTKPLQTLVNDGLVAAETIDWFLPHYSSGYFRDKVYDGIVEAGCDIPQEKWFSNLSSKGNTGSASIYIILEELFHSGKLKKGETLLCYIPESGRFSTAFMHLTVE
ncbi:MAG: beta-ketoacyl-ACP synthase III [Thermodesulfobacteriota bacterium]|nr:beta-ketoacyl-ACP synthase III [Thermodesulfobacteriota bacterium]